MENLHKNTTKMIYTYKKEDFNLEQQRAGWFTCFIAGYGTVKADTIPGLKFLVRRVWDFLKG
jgi:thiamine pyrophosphokinase